MNILVFGLNYKTAAINMRELFAFSQEELGNALLSLKGKGEKQEVLILSTCNRVEIYTYGFNQDQIKEWLSQYKNISLEAFSCSHSYCFMDLEAVNHIMRVACGLDSLVLGETEILGQMKSAFSLACMNKTIGSHLSRLFRYTFHVAKQVRSSTQIGACPVSVASVAVKFAAQWWNKEGRAEAVLSGDLRILIIGTGAVGRIVANHARSLTSHPLFIMSRDFVNAQHLAQNVEGVALDFSQLTPMLHEVDMIISATASPSAIISLAQVQDIKKPVLMMDLAVPRDIASDVTKNPSIRLCQLDELKESIQSHVNLRAHAATQAKKLIHEAAADFMLSLRSLDSDDIIKRYRMAIEKQFEEELKKALKAHHQGQESESVLKNFSRNVMNKILHLPSIQLRQASIEGREDFMIFASELLGVYEAKK